MEIPERYNRQLGLVYQETVEDLDILVSGTNPILPYLLTNLAFLGVGASQGGIYLVEDGSAVSNQFLKGQLLFDPTDLNTSIFEAAERAIHQISDAIHVYKVTDPNIMYFDSVIALPYQDGVAPSSLKGQKVIWGQVSNLSVHMGTDEVQMPRLTPNILTPCLSSLCAGLISQEMLRINDCIRPSDITKTWVTVNYLFRRTDAYQTYKKTPVQFRKFITGETLKANLEEPADNSPETNDNAIYRVELPKESKLHEFVIDSIEPLEQVSYEIRRPTHSLFFSPVSGCSIAEGIVEEPDINVPQKLSAKKAILLGIGGLGSWLASLFAIGDLADVDLVIVDEDQMVEQHNLNRQILFRPEDVGAPKAVAAENRLKMLNPNLRVRGYVGSLSLETIKCNVRNELISSSEFRDKWGNGIPKDCDPFIHMNRNMDLDRTLAFETDKADVVVACMDSLFGRYVASALAYSCKATLVNAGSQHFEGNTDLIPHEDGCILCWHGEELKYRKERVRCGELEAPTLSIVTTTSVVASIQTALLLSHLLGIGEPKHYIHYRGKIHGLSSCQMGEPDCPVHSKKDNCPKHLNWKNKLGDSEVSGYELF